MMWLYWTTICVRIFLVPLEVSWNCGVRTNLGDSDTGVCSNDLKLGERKAEVTNSKPGEQGEINEV